MVFLLLLCVIAIAQVYGQLENPNMYRCEVVAWIHGSFDGTEYGPFYSGDYSYIRSDFDNDHISSAIIYGLPLFHCKAYFFEHGNEFTTQTVLFMEVYHSGGHIWKMSSQNSWFGDSGMNDKVSLIKVRYESEVCRASFYVHDDQRSQSGDTLGVGRYSLQMLEARGIPNDVISSIRVEGDASCVVKLYSDGNCQDDETIVQGTGSYDLNELQNLGFRNDAMSCAIVTVNQGLLNLEYDIDGGVFHDPQIVHASSITISVPSGVTATQTVALSGSESYSWSFSQGYDYSVTVANSFTFGIPELASGSLTIEMAFGESFSSTTGGETITSLSQSTEIEVQGPNSIACSLFYTQATLTVPYSAVFQGVDEYSQYFTQTVTGTFTTQAFYDIQIECLAI